MDDRLLARIWLGVKEMDIYDWKMHDHAVRMVQNTTRSNTREKG